MSEPSSPIGDPGLRVVQRYREAMHVEPRWAVDEERGFKWWGHRHAQRVYASRPWRDERGGHDCARVTIETDFLLDKESPTPGVTEGDRAMRFAQSMGYAGLSGLVHDREAGLYRLRSSVLAHDLNEAWIGGLVQSVGALQLTTVERLGAFHSTRLGLALAESTHPEHGARLDPSYGVFFLEKNVQPEGKGPSRWSDDEEFEDAIGFFHSLGLPAGGEREGVARMWVSIGYGGAPQAAATQPASSVMRVVTSEGHPHLGAGVLIVLTLPEVASATVAQSEPLRLNALESAAENHPHFLGSWCVFPGGEGGKKLALSFATFVPNFAYFPGLLRELCTATAARAAWASRLLSPRVETPTI